MPATYEIQNDGALVLARYCGSIAASDVIGLFLRYSTDPDFRPDRPHVVDTTEVTASDAGFSEIFSIFSMLARNYVTTGAPLRVAIYARTDLTFGLARIFQNLAESSDSIEAAIFDSLEDARAWALSGPATQPRRSTG